MLVLVKNITSNIINNNIKRYFTNQFSEILFSLTCLQSEMDNDQWHAINNQITTNNLLNTKENKFLHKLTIKEKV